ncbi:MAG: outer membrane protein assembly factor BamD [Gammaproteobacteria bacterium]|nr:outer membrane protein assembly factor BamD [Gammaproteobacteria bacterium]
MDKDETKMKKILLTSLACASLLLTACSSGVKADPYTGDNQVYIYAKAQAYLQKNDYSDAITAYQSLDAQYPFEEYSQKGDLSLIYAYYMSDQAALALTSADRYIHLYPSDPTVAYAYYMIGVVDFENGRGFLQRRLPYDMAQHNPDNYTVAFNSFKQVVSNYPDSAYSADSRHRMMYINNTLAQYQLNVANFYLSRKAYVAAASRAQNVLINYPQTPAVQGALEVMVQSYKALGLPDLEKNSQAILATNFPSDPLAN